MLETEPLSSAVTTSRPLDGDLFATAIGIMRDCEEATTACAMAMLAQHTTDQPVDAILRDLDCTDVVAASRRVLSRHAATTALLSAQLEACRVACEQSNALCAPHAAHHDHCRTCSEATRRCAEVCEQLLKTVCG